MDIRQKRILRVILPMLLIVSFLSQSIVSLALTGSVEAGSGGAQGTSMNNTDNIGAGLPDGHIGWLISIQEVDNSYFGQGSSLDYNECAMSIWSKYLYDYPTEYVEDCFINADKYAYMDWYTENKFSDGTAMKVMNAQGYPSSSSVANTYSTYKHQGSESSFESAAQIIENSGNYENIKAVLEARTLTASDLTGLVTTNAIYSFVGLWYKSGTAADRMNDFVFGSEGEELDVYDKMIRYLDLLLIVNAMCNNAYDSYIDDFCKSLNQDFSTRFVTILIASTISARGAAGEAGIFTLPNWYSYRAQGTVGVDALREMDGVGGGDIFSTASTTDNYASVQSSYSSNAPDKLTNTSSNETGYMSDTEANSFWWGGKKSALTTNPVGLYGNNPGNVGYTYISTGDIETPDPESEEWPTDTSNSNTNISNAESEVAATNLADVLALEFEISAESEDYMLRATESGGEVETVDVTVTIDLSQTEANRRNIKLLYDALDADESQEWETALEIIVERTFDSNAVDSTKGLIDVNINSEGFNNIADHNTSSELAENVAIFRWEGVDWYNGSGVTDAYSVFSGQQQIQFTDMGIAVDTSAGMTETIATYHCSVRFTYYPKGYSAEQRVNNPTWQLYAKGTGKYECDSSCTSGGLVVYTYQSLENMAHDYASWVYLNPEDVAYYTSLNPDNYAELKHNDVGSETYEAMAGISTDENLRQATEVA